MIKVLSYNLLIHKAYGDVERLIEAHKFDLVCLQEVKPNKLHDHINGLKLAQKATLGMVGLATYYNPKILKLIKSEQYQLSKAWYERHDAQRTRLLIDEFTYKNGKLIIGNAHLSHLAASNKLRRDQANDLFARVEEEHRNKHEAAIIVGDFNYPVYSDGLTQLAKLFGYHDAGIHDKKATHKSRVVKGRFDRIFVNNLKVKSYEVLPFGTSDHAPIVANIAIEQ